MRCCASGPRHITPGWCILEGGRQVDEPFTGTQAQLELARIVIAFGLSDTAEEGFQVPAHHVPFLSAGEPDVVLSYEYDLVPDHLLTGELLFDTGHMWSFHRNRHGLIWRQMSMTVDAHPQRVAVFAPDFRSGKVYSAYPDRIGRCLPYPLYHPLDKFLLANLLAGRRGVTCHACGVDDNGHGMLFVGESGAGKSTMAQLWDGRSGVTVLSDERTIVRLRDGRFYIYGTPWYGSAGLLSPMSAPLSAIFFLRHGPDNRLTKIQGGDILRRLMVCTYLPFWSAAGIDQSLWLFNELSLRVPCYELTFVPDGKVLELLRSL